MSELFPKNFGEAKNETELEEIVQNNSDYDRQYLVVAARGAAGDIKASLEELWVQYKPYADPGFPQKLQKEFNAHTWEMYLGCLLLRHGFALQPKSLADGPDLKLLINGKVVWIEAVTCKEGQRAIPGREGYGGPVDGYDFPRILRITNSISEKFRKYQKYLENGAVKADEAFVIAVNGNGADAYMESQIFGAVYAVGNWVVKLNSDEQFRAMRKSIPHPNGGESIPADWLLNDEYKGISGIIFSGDHFINAISGNGKDLIIAHHISPAVLIEKGTFRFGTEFWPHNLDESGTKYVLSFTRWQPDARGIDLDMDTSG